MNGHAVSIRSLLVAPGSGRAGHPGSIKFPECERGRGRSADGGVPARESPAEVDALIACQQSRLDSLSRSIARLKRVRDSMTYQGTLFGGYERSA